MQICSIATPLPRVGATRQAKAVLERQLDPTKCALIDSMIRVLPNPEARRQLHEALQNVPTEALARVSQYGTALEVYDKNAAGLPLYAQHLRKPNCDGSYSPTANVVFVDLHNLTPLVLLHEFSHALDMAVGEISRQPEWLEGCAQALAARACIRPYATRNSAEYFADNLAAHLIEDSQLVGMLQARLSQQPDLDKRELAQSHLNYSRGRQLKVDPTAHRLCSDFLQKLSALGEAPTRPALTPEAYREIKVAELQRRKQAT